MTRVKVCAITRPEDAQLAVELGAWAIGFILWPGSPRYVDPALAAGIARLVRRNVQLVGVFVNQPLDEIAFAADEIGLTPENVAEAIEATRPWAVDVASGVEREPGVKDPELVRAFVTAVQHAPAGARA